MLSAKNNGVNKKGEEKNNQVLVKEISYKVEVMLQNSHLLPGFQKIGTNIL